LFLGVGSKSLSRIVGIAVDYAKESSSDIPPFVMGSLAEIFDNGLLRVRLSTIYCGEIEFFLQPRLLYSWGEIWLPKRSSILYINIGLGSSFNYILLNWSSLISSHSVY